MALLSILLDNIDWKDIVTIVGLLIFVIWAVKSGIPAQLFSTTNKLLEKRTQERDDAKIALAVAEAELLELKADMKTLHRELMQRMDISKEDQEQIKELKDLLKNYEIHITGR